MVHPGFLAGTLELLAPFPHNHGVKLTGMPALVAGPIKPEPVCVKLLIPCSCTGQHYENVRLFVIIKCYDLAPNSEGLKGVLTQLGFASRLLHHALRCGNHRLNNNKKRCFGNVW